MEIVKTPDGIGRFMEKSMKGLRLASCLSFAVGLLCFG
jgi:hypothetical protein